MAMLNSLKCLPKKGDIVEGVEVDLKHNLATIVTRRGSITVHTTDNRKANKKNSPEVRDKLDEIDNHLIEFLTENLRLEVSEDSYGFNGECIIFKLVLCDKTISEDFISTKNDDD